MEEQQPLITPEPTPAPPNPARKAQQLKSNTCALITLSCVALVVLVLTLVSIFAIPVIVTKQLKQQLIVDSASATGYNTWAGYDNPPIYYSIYVWNVENPQEAARGTEKVHVKQVGPYVFREYRLREAVNFTEDGNVVEYYQWQYYVFDKNLSAPGLEENDTFVTGNVALQGVVHNKQLDMLNIDLLGQNLKNDLIKGILCEAWKNNMSGYEDDLQFTPFVRVPVAQYFFGMKNESILVELSNFVDGVNKLLPILNLSRVTTDFPGLGVLNYTDLNDTRRRSGPNVQYTGKNDTALTGKYIKWQNMTHVHVCPLPPPRTGDALVNCPPYQTEWTEAEANANGWVSMWGTEAANLVEGTDMLHWQMLNYNAQRIGFVDQLYRWGEVEAKWGSQQTLPEYKDVPAMRFGLRDSDLLNATINPANAAYFDFGPSGLLNVTMKAGLPFFVSKPHFLDADPRLINGVIGVDPSKNVHESYIIVDELAGQTIAANQSVQLNVLIPNANFGTHQECILNILPCCTASQVDQWNGSWALNKTTEEGVFLPILFIVESFVLTEDQAKELRLANFMYNVVPHYAPLIGFPILAVVVIGTVVLLYQRRLIVSDKAYDDDAESGDPLMQHRHHHHQHNAATEPAPQ